jgi:NAD(P)-dependent dehydrogenase (short-subunit alcohol dehydrogenase family)
MSTALEDARQFVTFMMQSTPDFILVSGATSGVGLELAKKLILEGKCVYAIGRSYERFSASLLAWSIEVGRSNLCQWISFDFSKPFDIPVLALRNSPCFSGFVNCAAVLPISPLKLQKGTDINDAFNINLISPVLLTRELLKSNRISRGASIVYLSSISGFRVGPKAHACYSASKAGISGFSMSLANELCSLGVRVNCVAPGSIDTPMLDQTKSLMSPENFSDYVYRHPLGIGSTSSVLPLIEFLLDNERSGWITGQTFVADGGYTLN